jgi:hypothetical protein
MESFQDLGKSEYLPGILAEDREALVLYERTDPSGLLPHVL